MMHMGNQLKRLLRKRGWRQVDIAQQVGMTKQRIGQLIQARHWRADTIDRISKALRVPVSYWFQ